MPGCGPKRAASLPSGIRGLLPGTQYACLGRGHCFHCKPSDRHQRYGKSQDRCLAPSKRGKSSELVFSDLRAIPFVGSWSQLKQNVPGFYGVGTALKYYEEHGNFQDVKDLYNESRFFKTLIENSMMSLSKSFFDLTKYMAEDDEFGEFWNLIYKEFELSKRLILKLTGYETLMEEEPTGKASIEVRESIVLPLLTIQQYALRKIQEFDKLSIKDSKEKAVYEKLVTRSLFGNINASRNSA